MGKLLGNKIFVIGGSLVVLLALGVVLGLTIVRIQNQQTTVAQPKAYGDTSWPACAKQGPFAYQGDLGCCSKIPSKGSDACSWPARGWCKPDQCSAGIDIPNQCSDCAQGKDCTMTSGGAGCLDSDGKCQNKSRGCRCGLYYQDSTSTCQQGCSWQFDCPTGKNCVDGACVTTNNPCWVNVPIPKNGAPQGSNVSRSPTFSWTYDTTYSSDVKGTCVYLWSCAARTDSCYVGAACGNGANFTSVDFSKFGKPSLAANTTHYWSITVNSYSPPDSKYACMPGYSFTTGTSGGISCSSGLTACGSTCVNLQTNVSNCGACGNACDTGQACSAGACITGTPGGQFACDGLTVSPSSGATPLAVSATVGGHDATGRGDVQKFLVNFGDNTGDLPTGGSDANVISHTYSQAGTFTAKGWILDRDGAKSAEVAECQKTVTVTGTTTCTADAQCPSGQRCVSGACTTTTSEVNACWGNGGNNGRCYDCNGDGEVNILDFACFRAKYQQNVL